MSDRCAICRKVAVAWLEEDGEKVVIGLCGYHARNFREEVHRLRREYESQQELAKKMRKK